MVSPDPGTSVNGSGAPPGVSDPYKMVVNALPLSDEVVSLLKPAFDLKGFPLKFDATGLMDPKQNPLPHYQVETDNGKIFLIHLAEEFAANASGQILVMGIATRFLNAQSIALFVFSEADSFAFNTEFVIETWQIAAPNLKVRFVSLPVIQQLKFETSDEQIKLVRELLYLDDLLVANQIGLEAQIENAYKEARPDLLDNIKGLPESLTEADRRTVVGFLAQVAGGPPLLNSKIYLYNLVANLGLEYDEESRSMTARLNSIPDSDASFVFFWLQYRKYPNGPNQDGPNKGYTRVLGFLLNLLVEAGGGNEIVFIMFKYKLVADNNIMKELLTKYPLNQ